MTNPMQSNPERLRLALDNGEEVELDGGTLAIGGEESPSVVLRFTPWRARSMARVLEEWSAISRVFHRAPRPILTELERVTHAGSGRICPRRAGTDRADAARRSNRAESPTTECSSSARRT